MSDAIIWITAIAIVIAAFWAIIHEQKKRSEMTEEEYLRRAREEPSLISRGIMEFDQIAFRPQAKAAVEYQHDKMQGQTPDQDESGEKLRNEPQ